MKVKEGQLYKDYKDSFDNPEEAPVYLTLMYTSPAVDTNYMDYTYIISKLKETGKCKIHTEVIDNFTHQVFITAPYNIVQECTEKTKCNVMILESGYIAGKHKEL